MSCGVTPNGDAVSLNTNECFPQINTCEQTWTYGIPQKKQFVFLSSFIIISFNFAWGARRSLLARLESQKTHSSMSKFLTLPLSVQLVTSQQAIPVRIYTPLFKWTNRWGPQWASVAFLVWHNEGNNAHVYASVVTGTRASFFTHWLSRVFPSRRLSAPGNQENTSKITVAEMTVRMCRRETEKTAKCNETDCHHLVS